MNKEMIGQTFSFFRPSLFIFNNFPLIEKKGKSKFVFTGVINVKVEKKFSEFEGHTKG